MSDKALLDYVNNRLDEAEDHGIEEHLGTCAECERRLREIEYSSEPIRPPVAAIRRLRPLGVPIGRAPEDLPPPEIDGYQIEGVIGRGGMGVVYRAQHPEFGTVALKTMAAGWSATHEEIEQFLVEARAARAMSERALRDREASALAMAQVFEIGECRGVPFLSMELAAGGSLAKYLDEMKAKPREIARIMAAVAGALAAMHRDGFVHRDVKPENILLQIMPGAAELQPPYPIESLHPLVADYGLAKRLEELGETRSTDEKGTRAYMAPEQVRNGKVATPGTDLWAFGVTLYRLLTGVYPFEGRTAREVLNRISTGHPVWPSRIRPDVPPALEAICLKCLEWNPSNRYADADQIAADLSTYLQADSGSGESRSAIRRPGVGKRLRGLAWRNVPSLVAAGLALLAMAASAFLVWGLVRDRDAALTRSELETSRRLQAEEATRQAARLAESEQKAAHAATVSAGRARARQGNWAGALPLFEAAIANHQDDDTALRVERLFGFFATNDPESLARELESLKNRDDLGPLGTHVQLVRGCELLCDPVTRDDGRAMVRQTLDHLDDLKFSPADPWFARAMAEESPRRIVDLLRQAVREDPLHFPAGSSLMVALLGTGELDEALRQSVLMQGFLPDAPLPLVVQALIHAIEGDRDAMNGSLDLLESRNGTEADPNGSIAQLRGYCEGMADLMARAEAIEAVGGGLNILEKVSLDVGLVFLANRSRPSLRPFTALIPTASLPEESIRRLFKAYGELEQGDGREESYAMLLSRIEEEPEALYPALAASNRLYATVGAILSQDLENSRKGLVQIALHAEQASRSPTLIPRSPIRYQARILCAISDVAYLKLTPDADPMHMARLRDLLHPMVVDGRKWPKPRREGLNLFLEMLVAPLTAKQAADWCPADPEGLKRLFANQKRLAAFGKALVLDWMEDEPDNENVKTWLDRLDAFAASQDPPP